jgi:hypothetical protein
MNLVNVFDLTHVQAQIAVSADAPLNTHTQAHERMRERSHHA